MMKAYAVQDDDSGGIFYATSSVAARRIGANDLNTEFEYVTCCRAPWADEYAPGPCPQLVMIAHGWWFECSGCTVKITDDGETEDSDGNPIMCEPVENGGRVWCTPACRDRDRAERAETKRREIAAIAAATEQVARRYRGVLLEGRPHAYVVQCHDGDYSWWVEWKIIVSFSFPGQKHGTVHWREEFGKETVLLVPSGDLEAWKAWKAGLKMAEAA